MVPVRLQLQNFMSYGDSVPALELEGVHLACLSGENGHGKSALLDAITWALWGRARTNHDDELMRIGATDMQVELDFDLAGSRYRVLRRRTKRGKTGQSTLELQILEGDNVRPLTGSTISETQRSINNLLRLDYETFINSAYLRQGRADQFTIKSPTERKEVLSAILGLSLYDELAEKARAASRQCEVERRECEAQIVAIDAELAKQGSYQSEMEAVSAQVSQLEDEVGRLDERLELLRQQLRHLNAMEEEQATLQQVQQRHQADLKQLSQDIAGATARIAAHRQVLSRREEIQDGYRGWQAARQREAAASQLLGQLIPLQDEKAELERKIDSARQSLVAVRQAMQGTIRSIEQKIAATSGKETELGRVRDRLQQMADLDQKRQAALELLTTSRSRIELLKSSSEHIEEQGRELREKLDLLKDADATCPLCGSELGQDARDQLQARLTAERTRLRADYTAMQKESKDLEGRVAATQQALAELERGLRDRLALQRREVELQHSLDEAKQAGVELDNLQKQSAELAAQLENEDFAQDEQAQLREITARIEALGYDRASHEQARQEAARLAQYERLHQEMEIAAQLLASEEQTLARLEADAQARQADLEAARQRSSRLALELEKLPELRVQISELEASRRERHLSLTENIDRRGRLQQILDHCRLQAERRTQLHTARARLAEDKAIYDDLAQAYGKNGIQAMLIDAVLPELEEEANALLARMTDAGMQVTFETQRQARTRDHTIETLDIRIADDVGTRAYELFSGGEAFRANFAIRVALSKLLARRAGTRLQTLIIDEGFGTQDTAGRERLVEAINSISPDFERILVITHIEEMKDAFPVRIEVTKTAEGSQILVSSS